MARKRREEDKDNHERWLISYADFITLLFAFFVVMYATSSINEGKYRVFGNSLISAFGNTGSASRELVQIKPVAKPSEADRIKTIELDTRRREKMQGIAKEITTSMASLVKEGQVRVTQSKLGVTVEINASLLFTPAQAVLEAESVKALKAVAQVLKDDSHDIQVEGHTDNLPIATSNFPSNWELSSARASSVVRLFVDSGIAPTRLVAVGYGENRPVESNDTPEGRARNRRVTILILAKAPDAVMDVSPK